MKAVPWLLGIVVATGTLALRADDAALAQAAKNVRTVIGHRGSCADRPENTLASYRRAIAAGAHVAETDVRTTKDGVLVCIHDADVSRSSNGQGQVGALTLAELKRLDFGGKFAAQYAGERIATLREVLALCQGKIDVMLDLKETGQAYAEQVTAEVRKFGAPKRTVIGVRSAEQARQFRKLLPEARQIGLIPTEKDVAAFAAAGVETIRLWPKWLGDPALVAAVRKHRCALLVGAGNGTRTEVVAVLQAAPEAVSSDDPARLVQTLRELAAGK